MQAWPSPGCASVKENLREWCGRSGPKDGRPWQLPIIGISWSCPARDRASVAGSDRRKASVAECRLKQQAHGVGSATGRCGPSKMPVSHDRERCPAGQTFASAGKAACDKHISSMRYRRAKLPSPCRHRSLAEVPRLHDRAPEPQQPENALGSGCRR
jgi:hypothetical protein